MGWRANEASCRAKFDIRNLVVRCLEHNPFVSGWKEFAMRDERRTSKKVLTCRSAVMPMGSLEIATVGRED